MTDIWNICDTKDIIDEGYVDAMKIDGRLYGFPISNGNGTVTYVRKDWLDECNMKEPETYSEFIDMLRAFKKKYPDCIPLTSAGLMNSEYPYNIYLPEFYQDARPDIYQKDNGTYVDGMREQSMKAALQRLKDAYEEGLIDPDIATNGTKACREKVTGTVDKNTKEVITTGNTGVFNYWAGNWAKTLRISLKDASGEEVELVEIKPIKETTYIERPALALVIPKYCENPEGVFKYFIEYMHDGGEGQILFSIGVEGVNWKETKNGKETLKNDKSYYTPELSMLKNDDLNIYIDPIVENATKILSENSQRYPQPVMNKEIGSVLPDIVVIRREIINEIVTTDTSVEDGLASYEKQAGAMVDQVLASLNSEEVAENE
jgi:putative aldouronate transport system substrate-binding protein